MRKIPFVTDQIYHVYNRGVDKRQIFNNQLDIDRFVQCLREFNTLKPIGSIFENSFPKKKKASLGIPTPKLVELIVVSLNHNHFHLVIMQITENGISKFMQRLGCGYVNYFNERYGRTGALFEGRFKARHVGTNSYLLHLSVYVNLNHRQEASSESRLIFSSWDEYVGNCENPLCNVDIILSQFESKEAYRKFAESTLKDIIVRKKQLKEHGDSTWDPDSQV